MLLALINEEARKVGSSLAVAVFLSGLANASVLFLLHEDTVTLEDPSARLFIMLLAACALYALCLRQCIRTIAGVFEGALYRVRCRIADKIRRAGLQGLEQIGTAEIYTQVTQQTTFISNSAWTIALAIHALVLLSFTALYIGSLSGPALVIVLLVDVGGGFLYVLRRRRTRALMRETMEKQKSLFEGLTDLLRGAKEVRLRTRRGDEILDDMQGLAQALKDSPTQVNQLSQDNSIFSRIMLFTILASLVFILPHLAPSPTSSLTAQVAAVVFMFGPLGSLLKALPEYERADLAAAHIRGLEQRLDEVIADETTERTDPWGGHFAELQAEGLSFRHTDSGGRQTFSMGPVSFSLHAGEIVFIVGGNGSGKTTLLRLLTTLYMPAEGALRLDGIPVAAQNVHAYREMIAAVFADFHLFKRLYGMSGLSDEQVSRTLELMQIGERTSCRHGIFRSLDLSTGQRKRLAMAVALLEDRPFYVFDEWAADQDPEFRRYYYEELLPELKRRGKTILAISHDDRYFHCADRVITMEYGAIRSIDSHPHLPVEHGPSTLS